jgi:hypothetical protein
MCSDSYFSWPSLLVPLKKEIWITKNKVSCIHVKSIKKEEDLKEREREERKEKTEVIDQYRKKQ